MENADAPHHDTAAAKASHPATRSIVESNIAALVARKQREQQVRCLQDRMADWIASFAGSMWFVYVHALLFGGWLLISAGLTPLPRWDPTLVTLAMFASVEAIFLSTFVLITQNRMDQEAGRRADLDLQISLLAEHEITRLLTLVRAIAERMQIPESQQAEAVELSRDVAPEEVLDALERREREAKVS